MRLNILIGGKAGQGINKVSEIVSNILTSQGYFTFNYRDYPSLIRGGHNFNILSVSDKRVGSIESKLDIIIALDEKTLSWADLVIVMENFQRSEIAKRFPKQYLKKRILSLDIPDVYSYMQPELIERLNIKMNEVIQTIH